MTSCWRSLDVPPIWKLEILILAWPNRASAVPATTNTNDTQRNGATARPGVSQPMCNVGITTWYLTNLLINSWLLYYCIIPIDCAVFSNLDRPDSVRFRHKNQSSGAKPTTKMPLSSFVLFLCVNFTGSSQACLCVLFLYGTTPFTVCWASFVS